MNPSLLIALCTLLFVTPGCDKVRNMIADSLGKSGNQASAATFVGPVTELADADYDAFINQKDLLVVVNFGATWCGPCRQLGPVLERVSLEFGDAVKLGKVDVDRARSAAMRNGVRSIPDVRFFWNGKQVHQFSGAQPENRIRETLEKLTTEAETEERKPESLIQRLLPDSLTEKQDQEPAEKKEPSIRPMEKDWLPPGIERR